MWKIVPLVPCAHCVYHYGQCHSTIVLYNWSHYLVVTCCIQRLQIQITVSFFLPIWVLIPLKYNPKFFPPKTSLLRSKSRLCLNDTYFLEWRILKYCTPFKKSYENSVPVLQNGFLFSNYIAFKGGSKCACDELLLSKIYHLPYDCLKCMVQILFYSKYFCLMLNFYCPAV